MQSFSNEKKIFFSATKNFTPCILEVNYFSISRWKSWRCRLPSWRYNNVVGRCTSINRARTKILFKWMVFVQTKLYCVYAYALIVAVLRKAQTTFFIFYFFSFSIAYDLENCATRFVSRAKLVLLSHGKTTRHFVKNVIGCSRFFAKNVTRTKSWYTLLYRI